jgi:hypothetical protein
VDLIMVVSLGTTARLLDPHGASMVAMTGASAECSVNVRSAAICHKTRAVVYDEKTWYSLMEYTKCRREFSHDQIGVMLQVWSKRQDLAGFSPSN